MEVEQSDAAKLGEIRQRWEKATPGPWRAWENNGRTFIDDGSPFHCVAKIATGWVDYGDANAQAIAEAPTDIAWLLALASRAVEAEARALAAEQDVETAHARVDNLCSRLPHCWS